MNNTPTIAAVLLSYIISFFILNWLLNRKGKFPLLPFGYFLIPVLICCAVAAAVGFIYKFIFLV